MLHNNREKLARPERSPASLFVSPNKNTSQNRRNARRAGDARRRVGGEHTVSWSALPQCARAWVAPPAAVPCRRCSVSSVVVVVGLSAQTQPNPRCPKSPAPAGRPGRGGGAGGTARGAARQVGAYTQRRGSAAARAPRPMGGTRARRLRRREGATRPRLRRARHAPRAPPQTDAAAASCSVVVVVVVVTPPPPRARRRRAPHPAPRQQPSGRRLRLRCCCCLLPSL